MVNKSLFSSIKSRLPRTNTVNEAGGAAYHLNAKHALAQLAATGTFNGTFYAQGSAQLDQLIRETLCEPLLQYSAPVQWSSWAELSELRKRSRDFDAEGFMIKRQSSVYQSGRKRGDWWKWKVDPYTIDAVMVYAQKGHGKRADLYSDYTFAVWREGELVPFAKAYSGLTDRELYQVTQFVRKHTLEKFGPVRTVTPTLVFEIHFEGINRSPRHKSGIAVRFPRIHRWRHDKKPEEANSLDDLISLIRD